MSHTTNNSSGGSSSGSSSAGNSHDLTQVVATTANRLRLVASDFSEAGEQVRRTHLADEIERALSSIVPGQREAFLRALEDKFPAWDRQVRLAPPPDASAGAGAGAGTQSQADQKELEDPSFLVTRLCSLAQTLSPDAKQAIVERLRDAGVIPPATGLPWSEQVIQTLRNKLQLGEQRKVDVSRLMDLNLLLIDLAARLHQLVGTAWRTIAPNADVKVPPGRLLSTMGRFVAADPSVSKENVADEVEKMRQLVASLIAAIGDVGRSYARNHVSRFAPSEITALVSQEKRGFMETLETKCWRKYLDMWDSFDEAAIEREIRETVAKFAETVLKGVAR
jgi:hypothetical protein